MENHDPDDPIAVYVLEVSKVGFTVIDNACDPFNFYWDSSCKSLAWWRN
jgi:hypothetical protein